MAVRKPSRTTVKRSTRSRTDGSREGELRGKAGSASQRLRKRRAATEGETPEEASVATGGQGSGVLPAAEAAPSQAAPLDASEAVEGQTVEVSGDIPSARFEDPVPATGQLRVEAASEELAPAADAKPPRGKRLSARSSPPSPATEAGKPERPVTVRNETEPAATQARSRKVRRPADKPMAATPTAEPLPQVATKTGSFPAEAASDTAKAAAARGLGIARALTEELTAFSQRLLEDNRLRAEELAAARSLPELVEIQARQLQAVSEAWLRHTARCSEIYLASFRGSGADRP